MGRYDGIIADATVAITDFTMKAMNGTGSGLMAEKHLAALKKELAILERDRYPSLLSRVKDALLDTQQDQELAEAARRAADLTYRLGNCLECRCITCGMIDERCRCAGCVYGAHVERCEGGQGIETRAVERGVYMVDGMPAVRAEYARSSGQTVITLVDSAEMERRYRFDPRTGVKTPL